MLTFSVFKSSRIQLLALIQSIKVRGLKDSFRIIYSKLTDEDIDRKLNVHTTGTLTTELEYNNIPYTTMYSPSHAKALAFVLGNIPRSHQDVFVDYGCGKGRALLIAFQQGFKNIKGLEISLDLLKIAKLNLESTISNSINFTLKHCDVLTYEPDAKDNVFYFYDPFSSEMFQVCLQNIKASFCKNPRIDYIIIHHNILTDWNVFKDIFPEAEFKLLEPYGQRFALFLFKPVIKNNLEK